MTSFIKLHNGDGRTVYLNPAHIVMLDTLAHPPRTLISTVDDTVTTVTETPEEVLEKIRREGEQC